MGRRIGKTYQTSTNDPATSGGKYGPPILWMLSRDTGFVYDGWACELHVGYGAPRGSGPQGRTMPDNDPPRRLAKKKTPTHKPLPSNSPRVAAPASAKEVIFPTFDVSPREIRIARLELIASECRMLLRVVPEEAKSWETAQDTRRMAREGMAQRDRYPDHPNAKNLVSWPGYLYTESEHALRSSGAVLEQRRAKWMWLDRAVTLEMLGFAPELAHLEQGTWASVPTPEVYAWLRAVHASAERELAEFRSGLARFKQPVQLKDAAKQINVRSDVLTSMLKRNNFPVRGTKRNPVGELEDVIECYPKRVKVLRAWAPK